MLNPLINPDQTKAKEPIDENLMDAIRENLERINDDATEALDAAGGNVHFKVNGRLGRASFPLEKADCAFITDTRKVTKAQAYVKTQGGGGALSFDINRRKLLNLGIDRIETLFTASIQQIARASSDLLSQSVDRASSSLLTQSVGYLEAAIDINSIINITGTQYRINLDGTGLLDTSLYQVGDYVKLDGTDGNLNDGIFQVLEVNRDNAYNLVLDLPAGTDQLIAQGTARLLAAVYTQTAAVEEEAFSVGEQVNFINHTDSANDGDYDIFDINRAGNNIVIKRTTDLVEQAAPAGEARTYRWAYNMAGPVNTEAFAVGEDVLLASHTNAANDGTFDIKTVNYNGNNIVVYNTSGVLQPTPAGTATTYRFVYLLNLNPATALEVGDNVNVAGATNAANDGTFEVKVLEFNATDSFVVYNPSGVDQPLAGGTASKTEFVVVLYEDPSSFFLAGQSEVELLGTQSGTNDGVFSVTDVNRTVVSPFNLVVEIPGGAAQLYPAGQVVTEISSIFTSTPSFTVNQDLYTIDLSSQLADYSYEDGTLLSMDLITAPTNAVDFSVNIK